MGTAVVRVANPKLDTETALRVCKLLDPLLFPKAKKLEVLVETKLGSPLAKALAPGGCETAG